MIGSRSKGAAPAQGTRILRWLIPIHRYLGIGLGLMMTAWCLSGVVMMYVSYPTLADDRRLASLEPLDFSRCCNVAPAALTDDEAVEAFAVEMLAGRPVLRVASRAGPPRIIDLVDGHLAGRVSRDEALAVAKGFAPAAGFNATVAEIDQDQWTVATASATDRPLHRVALGDAAGTELYVSSRTGLAVQLTTAHERFWNWLGAVPHWLYFAELRRHVALWTDVVVWMSFAGSLLALIGVYIGIARFSRRADRRGSPYRGLLYCHHVVGLAFGLFTISWVVSGFVSMNPWGFLRTDGDEVEREALQGTASTGAEVKAAVGALARAPLPADVVSVDSSRLNGGLYLVSKTRSGARVRFDASLTPAPLTPREVGLIASRLSGDPGTAPELLENEDDYYYGHHEAVSLPVYRVVGGGERHIRYYVDPVSGSLLGRFDANGRWYRWLHQGLHRLDFTSALRARPFWDLAMLSLMAGVTTVCGTGAWLGLKRLVRGR